MKPLLNSPASLVFVHEKIEGTAFTNASLKAIIRDIHDGAYSRAQIASFLTASAAHPLVNDEILALTTAMLRAGPCLSWESDVVVDKHCVGGLPGNRTTPIIVSILAALGLTVPKTSSRAITSAAGTADVMEVLAPVDLSVETMQKVVETEGGCIIWGGAVGLSPVDDDLVAVARDIGLDGTGQLVASILSKKLAAGSTHVVIDMPVGPTAKIETREEALALGETMTHIAESFGMILSIAITDGFHPIGLGVGPALEARDVVAVLKRSDHAPFDLRSKALALAGRALELSGKSEPGKGAVMAADCLDSGLAWEKFQGICATQGGMREIPKAKFIRAVKSPDSGLITSIDSRAIARLARLAGAPEDKTAGLEFVLRQGFTVSKGDIVMKIHSSSNQRIKAAINDCDDHFPMRVLADGHHN